MLGVDVGALVHARQKTGLPILRFLNRVAAGAHGDEAGQVLILGSEAIGKPRAHAGANQGASPQFISISDGSWLGESPCIERMTATSSIDSATWLNSSLTSMPLWPYFWNV